MVENSLFHDESLIEAKNEQAQTPHSQSSNNVPIIPWICAASPSQANNEGSEGSRHQKDTDVVNAGPDFFHEMVTTKQWLGREICHCDRDCRHTVDDAVEVVRPSPTSRASNIISDKSCGNEGTENTNALAIA